MDDGTPRSRSTSASISMFTTRHHTTRPSLDSILSEDDNDLRSLVSDPLNSVTARMVEQNLKDKFMVLRSAYEERIRDLSDRLQDTMSSLAGDELLNEMKQDPLSSAFIPAHLSEIINAFLKSEREQYIHQIMDKCASYEVENKRLADANASATKRLIRHDKIEESLRSTQNAFKALETEHHELKQGSQVEREEFSQRAIHMHNKIATLTANFDSANARLEEKTVEVSKLRKQYEDTLRALSGSERTVQEISKEMAMLDNSLKRERQLNTDLRDQSQRLQEQRDAAVGELMDIKSRFRYSCEELERTQMLIQTRGEDDDTSRKRINAMMVQVENMLSHEAAESAAAVSALLQKLKQVKQKMGLEIQRERHNFQLMEQEAINARKQIEELSKELRIAQDDIGRLRDHLKTEQMKTVSLHQENTELRASELRMQNSCLELQTRMKLAEERTEMVERMKEKEVAIVEGKVKLEAERMMEAERMQVDRRTATYHMQYQNELGLLKNKIRSSYAYGETLQGHLGNGSMMLLDDSVSDSKGSFVDRRDTERILEVYRTRLEEAASNIERLKRMVVDYRNRAEAAETVDKISNSSDEQKTVSDKKIVELRAEVLRSRSIIDQMAAEAAQKEHQNVQVIACLKSEVAALKQELLENQNTAIAEQEEDSRTLMDMKMKFEKLMSSYLVMVAKSSSENESKSTAAPAPSGGAILRANGFIDGSIGTTSAESLTSHSLVASQMFHNEDCDSVLSVEETLSELKTEFETELSKHERRRALTPMKLRTLNTSAVTGEVAKLRSALSLTKKELETIRSTMTSNITSIRDAVNKKVTTFAKRLIESHRYELETCRSSLLEAFEKQEETLNIKMSDQTLEHFEEIKKVRRLMLGSLENSLSQSVPPQQQQQNSYDLSMKTPEKSTSVARESGSAADAVRTVVHLELVVRAILSALVGLGLLSTDTGSTLEGIALSSGDHWEDVPISPYSSVEPRAASGQITALYNLLVSSLSSYVGKCESLVLKVDAMKRDLQVEMNRRQEVESQFLELQDTSELHSTRLHEASVEIVQARTEHEMLSELQHIETSSRVKGLLSRIKEIETEHLVNLEELRAESSEQQSSLRVSFEKELSQKQQQYEQYLSSLEVKLKAEQMKRQSLQAEMIEVQSRHQAELKTVEHSKLEAQKLVHDLEVELARLKLELHRDI